MRTTLLHNPGSGYGRYPKGRLLKLLRDNGYEPTYRTLDEGFENVPGEGGELLVVAGGDGTLRQAAKAMVPRAEDSRVPLAVLPLGTANNTARALGWRGTPEEIVPAWREAHPRPFDVGVAEGPWGKKHFLEAAGLGLFPEAITRLARRKKQREGRLSGPEEELAYDLRMMASALETQRVQPFQVALDGEDLSGQYLMVEAMNAEAVGPRLPLNAEAAPDDGFFEVVVLTEAERPVLTDYLDACANANDCEADPPEPPPLSTRSGKHLRVHWQGRPLHADSQVWQHAPPAEAKADPADAPATVELRLHAGALRLLTRS